MSTDLCELLFRVTCLEVGPGESIAHVRKECNLKRYNEQDNSSYSGDEPLRYKYVNHRKA